MTDRGVLFVALPGAGPIGVGLTVAQVRALESRGVHPRFIDHADPALPGVLEEFGGDQLVVVADGDAAELDLLAPIVGAGGIRFLWWDRGRRIEIPPSLRRADAPPGFVDGVLATWPEPGSDRAAPTIPTWTLGAGIDMDTSGDAACSRLPRTPLELALLGHRGDSDAFLVALRSVAMVRAAGVDTRLTVCATDPDDTIDPTRFDVFVQDFALGESVVARGGAFTVGAMGGFHAFVDGSNTESSDRALLEAMARRIPVLSSNVGLAALFDAASVPTAFRPGDAHELAERVVDLSRRDARQLAELGEASRAAVATGHSIEAWTDAFVAALDERDVPVRVATAAPAAVTSAALIPVPIPMPGPDAAPTAVTHLSRVARSLQWRHVSVAAALAVGTAVGVYAVVGTGGGDRVVRPDVEVVNPTAVTTAPSGRPTVAGATVTAAPTTTATSTPARSRAARVAAREEAAADAGGDTQDSAPASAPDGSTPATGAPAPATTQPAPPSSQPAPQTTQPAPPTTQPAPQTTQPAPPTTQPAPATTQAPLPTIPLPASVPVTSAP